MRSLWLLLSVLLYLFMSTPVMAAGTEQIDVYDRQNRQVKSVVFIIGWDEYFVNGQTPGLKMDARPFIQEDRTFVPVRYLAYALGVAPENIGWDGVREKVGLKLEGNSVEMTVGVKQIIANGQSRTIDAAPVLRESEGRTYLPARHIAEGLGFEVEWDGTNSAVICWPKGSVRPDVTNVVDYKKKSVQRQGEVITTAGGYQIPKDTNLRFPDDIASLGPNDPSRCEMQFNIDFTNGDLQNQWNDAEVILSQKMDNQTVYDIMKYAKQKTEPKYNLEIKTWISGGKTIRVGSPWGMRAVDVTIWSK